MDLQSLNVVSIESIKKVYDGSFIGDSIILFDEIADVPIPKEPRRMNCLLLALCLKGEVSYSLDTVGVTVHPNDIMLMHEGQITDHYHISPDCSGIAIVISYEFFSEIIQGVHELASLFIFSRTHPVFTLTPKEVVTILDYFNALKQKVEQRDHHFLKDTVRSLVMTMIYDISNAIYRIQGLNDKKQTRAESIFASFIKLVEKHFRKERRVGWYADQLGLSAKYLAETVKMVSHQTPNRWIDYYVTLELRVLLRNTDKSIKEITNQMHFPNQSFLGKYFKEHVGVSPSKYRRS